MATKKKKQKKSGSSSSSKAEKKLQRTVEKLSRRLDAAEADAKQWRKKAKKHQEVASGAKDESSRLRKRLDKATVPEQAATPPPVVAAPAKKAPAKKTAPAKKAPAKKATAKKAPAKKAPAKKAPAKTASAGGPDATWTLTALRAEARSRGLSGYSRASKSQLLARLS